MVKFTLDEVVNLVKDVDKTRIISILSHVDHGKSTLTDGLVVDSGIRVEDSVKGAVLADEKDYDDFSRCSIAPAVPEAMLYHEKSVLNTDSKEIDKQGYLVRLVDAGVRSQTFSKPMADLRIVDGVVIVVDSVEGVGIQTERFTQQALASKVKPILFLNKFDRLFTDLSVTDLEDVYKSLKNSIDAVNAIIEAHTDEMIGDIRLNPENGTVAFGSALHHWGFTLSTFAKLYAVKWGTEPEKVVKKLWGENFFDKKSKKWIKSDKNKEGESCPRGFCEFVLTPIKELYNSIMKDKPVAFERMISALAIKLPPEVVDLKEKALAKKVMSTWMPLCPLLLDLIVSHLPSPVKAQKYRTKSLYCGPLHDDCASAMRSCDPVGPVMFCATKLLATSEAGKFIAYGRVFSGTIAAGQSVRILGPEFQVGKKEDLSVKKIQDISLIIGRKREILSDCSAGSLVAIGGFYQLLSRGGTVTTSEDAHQIRLTNDSASSVVSVSVEPKSSAQLPKLIDELKKLMIIDPTARCYAAPTGEHIIAGVGETHLETLLKDITIPVSTSTPAVCYRETVTAISPRVVSKSSSKHNIVCMTAEPLDEKLVVEYKTGRLAASVKEEKGSEDAISGSRRFWSFGHYSDERINCLYDVTKSDATSTYINAAKRDISDIFSGVVDVGALCDEPMQGIQFNMEDVVVPTDARMRSQSQVMAAAKACILACELKAEPRLLEPIYLLEISASSKAMAQVYTTLALRNAEILNTTEKYGGKVVQIQSNLAVKESYGFINLLRTNTSGQAFCTMALSHWAQVPGDPFETGTPNNVVVSSIRARKGLKPEFEISGLVTYE